MPRRHSPAPRRPPVTSEAARLRIDELRNGTVQISSAPEDLKLPLDPDLRVLPRDASYQFELVVNDKVVSGLTLVTLMQRVNGQWLSLGGIAGLGTDPEARFQGYSRRLLTSTLRWLYQHDFAVSMLYGIRAFYPKFGYAPAFPEVRASLALRDAETVPRGRYRLLEFDPDQHLADVLRIYADNNAQRTGVVLRDPALWSPHRRGLTWQSRAQWRVIADAQGGLAGYLVCDSQCPPVSFLELGYTTRAVFPSVLRFGADLAWAHRTEHLELVLPADHAFLEFCRPLGLKVELRCRRDGGCLVRLINPVRALRKLAPALAGRVVGRGRLTLHTNLGPVGLAWTDGTLTVGADPLPGPAVRLPQWALAQLLYGYRTAEALADERILRGSAAGVAIVGQLFPLQPHYCMTIDEF